MADRTHVIAQAIKYRCDTNGIVLTNMEINALAMDIEEMLKEADTGAIVGWQKAVDCVRRDGGLMITKTYKGDTYTTVRGRAIHSATAKKLIGAGHVVPVKSSLFEDGPPQQYEAAIQ